MICLDGFSLGQEVWSGDIVNRMGFIFRAGGRSAHLGGLVWGREV